MPLETLHDEANITKSGFIRQDLIGPELSGPAAIRLASGRVPLATPLMNASNASGVITVATRRDYRSPR
jgi:hypothetical protein